MGGLLGYLYNRDPLRQNNFQFNSLTNNGANRMDNSSLFASNVQNQPLNQVLNSLGVSENDPIASFINALSKIDNLDNQKTDGSIFADASKRSDLLGSLVALDHKDDGQINGSVFNDNLKSNRELMEGYKKAAQNENRGNQEIRDQFLDNLIKADAEDNKDLDGSFLNGNISQSEKNGIQYYLKNSFTQADFLRMLMEYDKSDDGNVNGSTFKNTAIQQYMDAIDDGEMNNSAQNYINYLTNLPQDNAPTQAYTEGTDYYNNPDTYNPTGMSQNPNISGAYTLLPGGLDNPIYQQSNNLMNMTRSILNSVGNNAFTQGQFYGSTDMTTNPNVPVNPMSQQQMQGSASGNQLAKLAEGVASSRNTTGRCYAGVADAAAKMGVSLTGMSAYMAADQLANSSKFKEVSIPADQLGSLPAGAIVVWGKTNVSPHGHISVALGDGREASDHIQKQMTSLRGHTNCRVFIPV